MEARQTRTINRPTDFVSTTANQTGDALTQTRLDWLLAANADKEREKLLFRSEREKVEVDLMKTPMSLDKTFAYFGLLLGLFPPMALFARMFVDALRRPEDLWFLGVLAIVNILSATVGYFSGKVVGKIVGELEKQSWHVMILVMPFIGAIWGIAAGGAGGIIIFLVGAVFGAALGAMVGAAALPVFAILHRLFKKGDQLDQKHFLPLAFGVTFTICAFILGL